MNLRGYSAIDFKGKFFYEWDIETLDKNGDIIDHNHSDNCPGIPTEPGFSLVLVKDTAVCERDTGKPIDLYNRTWAYVENGKLPKEFENGDTVPKRFHEELAKTEARFIAAQQS